LWTKIGSRETWKTYFDGWSCWLPPTAFVCCSRGGKTRALIEIAQRLKSSVDTSVIFVSFNGFSDIQRWEQENPLGALCRRIAFAARRERNATFKKDFANAHVKPEQIIKWLGKNPRVLLIDELNLCTALSEKSNPSTDLASFLRVHFLEKENQYFAFSSHVISPVAKLCTYLDSVNDRSIAIRELPLIRNVLNATKIFDWPQLYARKALFYGLVPALIHFASMKEQEKTDVLPYWKRDAAIQECIKKGLVTNESVRHLLASFIDGDRYKVMEPLHQLMNTAEYGKLRWIPYHMTEVLHLFEQEVPSLDRNLREAMKNIVDLFSDFSTVQESSGQAWENLFLLVVMIRVVSRRFDKVILPLDFSMDYSISFNKFIRYDKKSMVSINNVDDFVDGFTEPDRYPHVAIYQPKNASFPLFGLIIAVYDKASSRKIYAYQVMEGREITKRNTTSRLRTTEFDACVVVRGKPRRGETRSKEQWIIPSKSHIVDFFGESGKHWTPEEWKKLMKKEK